MSKSANEEMMQRFERKSCELLGFLYFDLDELYAELSYNNRSLNSFMTGTLGEDDTPEERKAALDEIRERIPAIYEEIKYVKECIKAEKFNMNRLRSKYGNYPIKFRARRLNLDRHYRDHDWDENEILEQPQTHKRPPPLDGIYEDTFYCYTNSADTNTKRIREDDNEDADSTWNPFEFNDESYRDRYKFNPLLGTVEKE
jgi:hypothetical protein